MRDDDTIRLVDQLKRHEGFRGQPYLDTTGHLSIGYGRNLDDVPLSEDEAEYLLLRDLDRTHDALSQSLPLYGRLDPVRRAVLTNMAYNLGVRGLLGFRRMLAALGAEDWETAAREALDSRWAAQVGNRAVELAQMLRTGRWFAL